LHRAAPGLFFATRELNSPIAKHNVRAGGPEAVVGEIMDQQTENRSGWSWWYLLLLVQFVLLPWPAYYNKVEPSLVGIPFFYWYQMLWVIISAVLIAIVYLATEE
jgi:Protein of unknown function (DUF3311)